MNTIEDLAKLLRESQFTCGDEHNREPLGIAMVVHKGEREDGLLAQDGRRYWVSVPCSVCGYEWSFPKLFAYAARGQFDLQHLHPEVLHLGGPKGIIFPEVTKTVSGKPWKGICAKACWFARKRRCKCKCRKVNHQRGFQRLIDDFPEELK